MSKLTAPLPALLSPFKTPVHDQCSEESVFRLHPSPNPALEEPMHPSRNTNEASSKTRVSVKEEKRKDSPRKKSVSSVIVKKENAKRSSEDEEASSRKKLKDARSGSESTANSRNRSTDLSKFKIPLKLIQNRTTPERPTQEQTTQGRTTHHPERQNRPALYAYGGSDDRGRRDVHRTKNRSSTSGQRHSSWNNSGWNAHSRPEFPTHLTDDQWRWLQQMPSSWRR